MLLRPPLEPDRAPTLYSAAVLARVLTVLVRIWRPDCAVVTTFEYERRHVVPDGEVLPNGTPQVGWITYLRAERLTGLPAGQAPCKTVAVDDLGMLFVLAEDHRFTAENPEDVDRALALTAFLDEHGALETIPPNLPM